MQRAAGTVLLTTLLTVLFADAGARAQAGQATAEPEWVNVEPEGEPFMVLMPKPPEVTSESVKFSDITANARLYTSVGEDATTYHVLSFEDPRPSPGPDYRYALHYDQYAELAWELIVEPVAERVKRRGHHPFGRPEMIYRGEVFGPHFGREYRLRLSDTYGLIDIYRVGTRVLFVWADTASGVSTQVEKFLDSFAVKTTGERGVVTSWLRKGEHKYSFAPGPPTPAEMAMGVGRGGNTGPAAPPASGEKDYTRPFRASEVTRKAVIKRRPEPEFTDSARKFTVTGTVKLRLLLGADGKVANFSLVKGLPHGLTQQAIKAAQGIRFEPAEVDGHKVSQWIVIEYNFNIY